MLTKRAYFFSTLPGYLILLIAALQLIITFLHTTLTFTQEESMWHYIGRNWFWHGLVPYEGGVDNKSPLIFSIFGLSDWLFGVNHWFPRILGTVVESIGIYYVYRIARDLAGERAGLLAISLYGLSLLWKTTGGKLVSFTETYATAFVIISFYKCLTAERNKDFLLAGLWAGFAFTFRLSAAFGIFAVLVMATRKKWADAPLFLAGTLASIGLFLLLCSIAGIQATDIIHYGFTANFGGGSVTDHNLHWRLENFTANFFSSELILFYPFVIGYILIQKKIDPLLTWLLLTFIGINVLGIYARPHFKEILPALALTSAIALHHLSAVYRVPFKGLMIVVWICFFPKTLEPFWGLKKIVQDNSLSAEQYCASSATQADEQAEKKLGQWIKSVTEDSDLVYIAGYGARVQVFSERRSPAIFFNVTQTKEAKQKIMQELQAHPPALIAIPAFSNYTAFVQPELRIFLADFAAKNYMQEKCMYGYTIYKVKN